MFRLWTQVTTSPLASARSPSAASTTSVNSGPRAANRVTISSSPTSWPALTPASTSATGPRTTERERPGTSTGGGLFDPEYHCVERCPTSTTSAPSCTTSAAVTFSGHTAPGSSRPIPSASDRSMTLNLRSTSSHRSGSRANSG